MTASWPSTLPDAPLFDGYSEQPRMARATFESDVGPPIQRPRGTIRLNEIGCAMVMTSEQLGTFEDFVFADLGQATLPFLIDHPRLEDEVKVRLIGEPPYSTDLLAPGYWRVSFTMLVIG